MKRKCYFRRQALAPVVSKNQGSFQGIFHYILFREIAGKYFPSRFLSRKCETRLRKNLQLIRWKDQFKSNFDSNNIYNLKIKSNSILESFLYHSKFLLTKFQSLVFFSANALKNLGEVFLSIRQLAVVQYVVLG